MNENINEEQKDTYLAWLADAHAMELGLVKTLQKQARDTETKPEINSKIEEHLEKTREHAEKVEGCLRRNGGDPSTGKDVLSKMSAAIGGVTSSMTDDALVKNMHASYAAEHFEIGAYTLIAAAARELDDMETANICEDIIADEEDMANWLLDALPGAAMEHLEELVS
jgi:ferritin-like metal-binding protein YciE